MVRKSVYKKARARQVPIWMMDYRLWKEKDTPVMVRAARKEPQVKK